MNHIIVNNFGNYWQPNARASVEDAAERWGCELVVLNRRDWISAKLEQHNLPIPDGVQVMHLDADVVIRHDTPDPFDLVKPENFGGVLNFQGDTHNGKPRKWHEPYWNEVALKLGHEKPFNKNLYMNGGLIIWTKGRHDDVWDMTKPWWGVQSPMLEQTSWNVAVRMLEVPVVLLSREFNRIGPAVWESGPDMHCYVYHFASYLNWRGDMKNKRIAETVWTVKEHQTCPTT